MPSAELDFATFLDVASEHFRTRPGDALQVELPVIPGNTIFVAQCPDGRIAARWWVCLENGSVQEACLNGGLKGQTQLLACLRKAIDERATTRKPSKLESLLDDEFIVVASQSATDR